MRELNVYGLQLQSLMAGILREEMAHQASQQREGNLVMEGRQETNDSQTCSEFYRHVEKLKVKPCWIWKEKQKQPSGMSDGIAYRSQ